MDSKLQYEDLTKKILAILPLKAYPSRGLIHIFRDNGQQVTLKTELTITSVYNSGDISGIMCIVELKDKNYKMSCALTHLNFSSKDPLFNEISEYQRKREKRIKKLNQTGQN